MRKCLLPEIPEVADISGRAIDTRSYGTTIDRTQQVLYVYEFSARYTHAQ